MQCRNCGREDWSIGTISKALSLEFFKCLYCGTVAITDLDSEGKPKRITWYRKWCVTESAQKAPHFNAGDKVK